MTWHSPEELPPDPLRDALTAPDERAMAHSFARLHRDRFAWSETLKIWRVNDGAYWREDNMLGIHRSVDDFVGQLDSTVAAMPEDARKLWLEAPKRLKTKKGRDSLVSDEKKLLVVAESDYNADPFQLNSRSVINVKTGAVVEAGSRFTKITGAIYDPNARSQKWEDFLNLVLPDPEMRAYVLRAFGAGLSGRGGERLVFMLFGPPGSGKSTLVNIVKAAMGTYATTIRHDALAARQFGGSGHTSELMPLVGARMCFVPEIPAGMRLNNTLLKHLVGGDSSSVSEKGLRHVEVQLVAKLYLVGNHPIVMDAADDAAWARYHPLPFMHPIASPDSEAVMAMKDDPEVLSACLLALIEGSRAYQAGGLVVPAAAVQMAEQQRAGNSEATDWLSSHVEFGDGYEMRSRDAYESYLMTVAEGDRPVGTKRFAVELEALGLRRIHTERGALWLGARLIPAGESI